MEPTLSNWARWGADDQVGTLNHVTAATRRHAATLVRRGDVFSLAIPIDGRGPARPGGHRPQPRHFMTAGGSEELPALKVAHGGRVTDDSIEMPLQSGTQWDGLAHVYYGDQLYNGFPADSVGPDGCSTVGFEKICSRFVSRGVLLDVARLRRVESLGPDDVIDADTLTAACDAQGVTVGTGDIVLVRTGLMATWRRTGSWERFWGQQPGLDTSTVAWLDGHEVAAIAADNTAVEYWTGRPAFPLHMALLRDLGMSLGEFWYLEELADDCAADGVYDFLLVAPGLPVSGAIGSPVNPLAIK